MPNVLIALLMAVGVTAWVYSKMYRRTGGNTQNAMISAGLVGFLVFVAAIVILSTYFKPA